MVDMSIVRHSTPHKNTARMGGIAIFNFKYAKYLNTLLTFAIYSCEYV